MDLKDEFPIKKIKAKENEPGLFSALFPPHINNFSFKFTFKDSFTMLFLCGCGLLTRIIRMQFPRTAAGPELIYGPAINCYLNQTFFYSPKPSLGTLFLFLECKFGGFSGNLSFKPHTPYEHPFYVNLRFVSAFFSAFIVPISYLIARIMNESCSTSSLISTFFMTELLFISQGHLFSPDSIFHFFTVLSIGALYMFFTFQSFKTFVFASISIGLAFSTKSDGLLLIFIGLITIKHCTSRKGPTISRSILFLTIIFIIHFIVFSIHISILPFYNQYQKNTPKHLSQILINSTIPNFEKRSYSISHSGFFGYLMRYFELIWISRDPIERVPTNELSSWWEWISVRAPWKIEYEGEGKLLIAAGNPLIWITIFITASLNIFQIIIKKTFGGLCSYLFLGYTFSIIYYAFRSDGKCLTDYSIALIFGNFGLGLYIDSELKGTIKGFITQMAWSFSIFGYFFWNSIVYGKDLSNLDFLVWYDKWIPNSKNLSEKFRNAPKIFTLV